MGDGNSYLDDMEAAVNSTFPDAAIPVQLELTHHSVSLLSKQPLKEDLFPRGTCGECGAVMPLYKGRCAFCYVASKI